eukprot:TRINITY_DN17526_c0_g1_i2.p1 TRINITY_DN17526_c0_g1~~TRINITY_DN17526_c0_g1_i2.p1  ORF type:complete len:834 (+),score=157.21 TRINITY_DN17526_c0_g1_i2:30-2531(+)
MFSCLAALAASAAWLLFSLIYAGWFPGEGQGQGVTVELLQQQLLQQLQSIPLPPSNPRYHQYRQYYIRQHELQMQEMPSAHRSFDQAAFCNSLFAGVMLAAAVLAACEYHFGTLSFWMEQAELSCWAAQDRWKKWRQKLEHRRVERLIEEIGDCPEKSMMGKRNCRRPENIERKKVANEEHRKHAEPDGNGEHSKRVVRGKSASATPNVMEHQLKGVNPQGFEQVSCSTKPSDVVAEERDLTLRCRPPQNTVRERLHRKVLKQVTEEVQKPRDTSEHSTESPAAPMQKVGSELLREAEELLSQLEAEDLLRQVDTEEAKKLRAAERRKAKKMRGRCLTQEPSMTTASQDEDSEPGSSAARRKGLRSVLEHLNTASTSASSTPSEDSTSVTTRVQSSGASIDSGSLSDSKCEVWAGASSEDELQEPTLRLKRVSTRRRKGRRTENRAATVSGPEPAELRSSALSSRSNTALKQQARCVPRAPKPKPARSSTEVSSIEAMSRVRTPSGQHSSSKACEGVSAGQAILKLLQGSPNRCLRADAPEFVPSASVVCDDGLADYSNMGWDYSAALADDFCGNFGNPLAEYQGQEFLEYFGESCGRQLAEIFDKFGDGLACKEYLEAHLARNFGLALGEEYQEAPPGLALGEEYQAAPPGLALGEEYQEAPPRLALGEEYFEAPPGLALDEEENLGNCFGDMLPAELGDGLFEKFGNSEAAMMVNCSEDTVMGDLLGSCFDDVLNTYSNEVDAMTGLREDVNASFAPNIGKALAENLCEVFDANGATPGDKEEVHEGSSEKSTQSMQHEQPVANEAHWQPLLLGKSIWTSSKGQGGGTSVW